MSDWQDRARHYAFSTDRYTHPMMNRLSDDDGRPFWDIGNQHTLIRKHIRRARSEGKLGIRLDCYNREDLNNCERVARAYAEFIGWPEMIIEHTLIFS
jgi:hypothetical protein